MRIYLFLCFFLPALVYGDSASSYTFYGIYNKNNIVDISYKMDGGEWNNNKAIYGTSEVREFKYCWRSSSNNSNYFYCSSTLNSSKTVTYRKGSESDKKLNSEAMSLFKKSIKLSETGGLQDSYICDKGCTSKLPKFIYEVGDTGC